MNPMGPVWIDLDNSPHVPFFRPIVDELRARGHAVLVTARDAFNVVDLVRLHGLECTTIGHHFGKHRLMKVAGLGIRAAQLLPYAARRRPQLAVSHGSRAQTLAARLLRIPSIVIADYEHVRHVTRPDCMIVPEIIPSEVAERFTRRVLHYPGIKEDVYAASFTPDPSIRRELGLAEDDIVVTVRPPATEAHYHNPQSEALSAAALHRLAQQPRTRIVLLPRNERQRAEIAQQFGPCLQSGKMVVPAHAVEGLNLVWHSDLVISGGGTMNREAAALGVPVYSTFRGPIGAVDRYLAAQGRLVLLESIADVQRRIVLAQRERPQVRSTANRRALETIVGHIVAALDRQALGMPALQGGKS
jgi:uncharacterized protein